MEKAFKELDIEIGCQGKGVDEVGLAEEGGKV